MNISPSNLYISIYINSIYLLFLGHCSKPHSDRGYKHLSMKIIMDTMKIVMDTMNKISDFHT